MTYTRDDFVIAETGGWFWCPAFPDCFLPEQACPCHSHGDGKGLLTRMQMIQFLTDPKVRTVKP